MDNQLVAALLLLKPLTMMPHSVLCPHSLRYNFDGRGCGDFRCGNNNWLFNNSELTAASQPVLVFAYIKTL